MTSQVEALLGEMRVLGEEVTRRQNEWDAAQAAYEEARDQHVARIQELREKLRELRYAVGQELNAMTKGGWRWSLPGSPPQ